MTVFEAQERLKKTEINEEQLWAINDLYILLDLHKDDFCKIVDAVGLDKLIAKQRHFGRLVKAERELSAKERYLQARERLFELKEEEKQLEEIVNGYRPF